VCGVNLLKKERMDNCYHINFFAHRQESGSVLGAPRLFFTEALVPALDDTSIRLCVVVDPLREIGIFSIPVLNIKISWLKYIHGLFGLVATTNSWKS
jgi:hypothetical protein